MYLGRAVDQKHQREKGRVDVYEAVNNLDKRAQPSSTVPAFCDSHGAREDSHTVRPHSDARQPAAREVFQLTTTENVCFQRNGHGCSRPLGTQQPGPPAPPRPEPGDTGRLAL